jgi:outer membrane protein assembly factor BamA
LLNPGALEESRIHLQRLRSVERATVAIAPVADSDNVVDVIVTIMEEPTRRYGIGGGVSYGPLRMSYAAPLSRRDSDARWRDRIARFQVSFGVDF